MTAARLVALAAATAVASCKTEPTRPVRVQLQLHASCMPTTTYDVSCVQALQLVVRRASGEVAASHCTDVTGRYATMQDLIGEPGAVALLGDVEPGVVRLELRGYQVIDERPCDAVDDSKLMVWGSSEPVDLADASLATVSIDTECRPACDCLGLALMTAVCPRALEIGACAPASSQLCRSECEDDHTCYGAIMKCGDHVCVPEPRGDCDACTSDADCESGLCVTNTDTRETFCARPCPDLPGVDPCPLWMSCKRLGTGAFVHAGP